MLFISPPPRRDLHDLRHGHRPARRRGHARRPHRRHGHRRARPPDGRPRARPSCSRSSTPTIGETVLEVDAAHARGRVHRRLLRGPPRRDRRARRPRRRGPQRGRARDLRHRHARRRRTVTVDGVKLKPGSPTRGDEGRHRARARGPPPAGPGDGALASSATSASPACRRCATRLGVIGAGLGGQARHGLGDQAAAQVPQARATRSASCPAATSRRSCSASGSPPSPKVLIIDEPTRGIDVGTKAEVHRLMSELAGEGLAVLMISSELPEVLGMADRVLVMHEGRIARELSRAEADEESVVRAATGQRRWPRERAHAEPRRRRLRAARARRRRSWIDTIVRAREVSLIGVLAILVIAVSIAEPRFLNAQNLRDILLNVTIVGAARGRPDDRRRHAQHRPLGRLDPRHHRVRDRRDVRRPQRADPARVRRAASLFGAFFGLMNGVMVAWARVPSLVITLGTLYVIRGIDFAWAHGRQINAADMPDGFLDLGTRNDPRLPGAAAVHDRRDGDRGRRARAARRMGRELYAIGSNPDAAVLAGIRVSRRVLGAFVASRRDRRPRRRALRLPLRHARRGRRHRHRARRGRPRWSSAASPSSAAPAPSTAPRSARCCWPRSARRS